MTIINAKLAKRQLSRTPRWLRGPPRSLRSIINPEEVSIYRLMRKSIIQELRPKTSVEWILVNEFVNAHFSAMRYGTWRAAVMQFSVGEGLRRAVKNQLRSGNKGSEADLDWRAQELAGSMRPYVNDHAIEAEMYLSRRSEMDSIGLPAAAGDREPGAGPCLALEIATRRLPASSAASSKHLFISRVNSLACCCRRREYDAGPRLSDRAAC